MSNTREEQRWNRLADRMQVFHSFLKSEFEEVYELADGSFNKRGMSLPIFLRSINEFRKHLETHHNIEERFIFPMLAQKMPAFAEGDRHKEAHKTIHDGLDKLASLVAKFRDEPSQYSPKELRDCLDAWRGPLFDHLEEEVRDLSAPNMQKYWTLEELEQIPM